MKRFRDQPGMPAEAVREPAGKGEWAPAPELTPSEMADYTGDTAAEEKRSSAFATSPAFLRRTLFGLLGLGGALLAFVLVLELVEAVQVLLEWPLVASLPVFGLLVLIFGYIFQRIFRLLLRWRRLPKGPKTPHAPIEEMEAKAREALCAELRKRLENTLHYLRAERGEADPSQAGDNATEAPGLDRALQVKVTDLLEAGMEGGSRGWLEQYRVLENDLAAFARREITKVARTAGLSAALSPWRLLDAAIGFNASFEAADRALRCFGIRPDREMVMGFALDAFVTTFFSTAAEQVLEDLSADLAADLHGSLAKVLGEKVAPKVAEGLAVALFVRRVGRRMVRRLTIM